MKKYCSFSHKLGGVVGWLYLWANFRDDEN